MLSYNPAEAGTVAVSITQAVITIANNNGAAFSTTDSTTLAFNVVLTDPCATTTINAIATIASTSLTVTDGGNTETTFTIPDTALDVVRPCTGQASHALSGRAAVAGSMPLPFGVPFRSTVSAVCV